jgi:hypothetical protein
MNYRHFQIRYKMCFNLLIGLLFFNRNCCFAQSPEDKHLFLGQTPPGNTPQVFPLAVKTGFFAAERVAISDDGRNIYYTEIKGYYPIRGEIIKRFTYTDGEWTGPSDLFEGYAPALSLTGDTMYLERDEDNGEACTYISVRNGKVWGNPEKILTSLDTAHYFQATNKGNYYISSKTVIGAGLSDWCKVVFSGKDTIVSSLGRPLNTSGENQDFFISRDESFMIVTNRPALGISYHKPDGSWTSPKIFDKKINFGLGSWGPWVTPDNKYLFYSTGTKADYSDVAVYWVRIDNLIDSMKTTNQSPYIMSLIQDQPAVAGQLFTFKVPDNIFFDDDSKEPLTYTAKIPDGSPIPAWLSFNPSTRSFSGIPAEPGVLTVYVFVTDSDNATAFCPVKIIISQKEG